jgi:hypothetical protein
MVKKIIEIFNYVNELHLKTCRRLINSIFPDLHKNFIFILLLSLLTLLLSLLLLVYVIYLFICILRW